MTQSVYIIPGRGNGLSEIGNIVSRFGFNVVGREILPPFSSMRFSEQLVMIKENLITFWTADAFLIGHSYGAYLLLHSLAETKPFPGKILLFSPVLGAAPAKNGMYLSQPPRAKKLLQMAEENQFPFPDYLEIHIGENDDGCAPELAMKFISFHPKSKLFIVKQQGHQLNSEYMNRALFQFFVR
jgi:predicted alpha/beta hydrolase family esterase